MALDPVSIIACGERSGTSSMIADGVRGVWMRESALRAKGASCGGYPAYTYGEDPCKVALRTLYPTPRAPSSLELLQRPLSLHTVLRSRHSRQWREVLWELCCV